MRRIWEDAGCAHPAARRINRSTIHQEVSNHWKRPFILFCRPRSPRPCAVGARSSKKKWASYPSEPATGANQVRWAFFALLGAERSRLSTPTPTFRPPRAQGRGDAGRKWVTPHLTPSFPQTSGTPETTPSMKRARQCITCSLTIYCDNQRVFIVTSEVAAATLSVTT